MLAFVNHLMWRHEQLQGWSQLLRLMDERLHVAVTNAMYCIKEAVMMYDPTIKTEIPGFAYELTSHVIEARKSVSLKTDKKMKKN